MNLGLKINNGNLIFAIAISCAIFALGACDPNRMPKKTESTRIIKETRKACIFVAGGTYGKSGLRARQFVGKGPKMRAAQWKTANYLDEMQALPEGTTGSKKPSIEVQISWRVSTIQDANESSFQSLEAKAIHLPPNDLARAAFWRIGILDNESADVAISKSQNGQIYDLFSSEDRGKQIPAHIGEALGGVNGGAFYIALIGSDGTEILSNTIKPMRGYEFKDKVKLAFEGLDLQLKDEKNCSQLATQLRLEKHIE